VKAIVTPSSNNLYSFDLYDVPFREVFRVVGEAAGVTVTATSPSILDTRVTAQLSDQPLKPGLSAILELHQLTLRQTGPTEFVVEADPRYTQAYPPPEHHISLRFSGVLLAFYTAIVVAITIICTVAVFKKRTANTTSHGTGCARP
jgi:hypothetical protein